MRAMTILLVDDSADVAELFKAILVVRGHAVDAVTTGAAAVELFSRRRHDLVIADLRMPDMSGWEVVERVRALAAQIPIIAVSGLLTDEDQSTAVALDVVLLEKPLRPGDLEAAVAAQIERYKRLAHDGADDRRTMLDERSNGARDGRDSGRAA